jgi:hypothetical protein
MTPDRRRFRRLTLDAPVKLRLDDTGRYLPARSLDISDEGLLLELDRPARIPVGTAVRLAVQRSAVHAVARLDHMTPATVVRLDPDARRLALRFTQPVTLAATPPAIPRAA